MEFGPTFNPLTFHWKIAVIPPFIGIAVRVTGIPAQIGFADELIVKLTGKLLLTDMMIEFEDAVAAAVSATGAAGPQDMGKVIGALKAQLAGKADMGKVSALVKAALAK